MKKLCNGATHYGALACNAVVYRCNGSAKVHAYSQGQTDNSWGSRTIGDHGAPVSLPKLKKAYEKGTRGISWGPLLTLGPRAVPEFPNGQSAPGAMHCNP
ncbi:unnamed protein product [Staurois parvus]|uniref:Uncharacterized protein n=1 Tax=Staurois parvus TaxID=386267 RepID=A0ABN9GYM0_9NEOB|nr:unnamed protein product [Staurois parvus]